MLAGSSVGQHDVVGHGIEVEHPCETVPLMDVKAGSTLTVAEVVPMDTAKYDLAARLREQRRILELIPPPEDVFDAAAKNACIQAGLSQETIHIIADRTPNLRAS